MKLNSDRLHHSTSVRLHPSARASMRKLQETTETLQRDRLKNAGFVRAKKIESVFCGWILAPPIGRFSILLRSERRRKENCKADLVANARRHIFEYCNCITVQKPEVLHPAFVFLRQMPRHNPRFVVILTPRTD